MKGVSFTPSLYFTLPGNVNAFFFRNTGPLPGGRSCTLTDNQLRFQYVLFLRFALVNQLMEHIYSLLTQLIRILGYRCQFRDYSTRQRCIIKTDDGYVFGYGQSMLKC